MDVDRSASATEAKEEVDTVKCQGLGGVCRTTMLFCPTEKAMSTRHCNQALAPLTTLKVSAWARSVMPAHTLLNTKPNVAVVDNVER